MDGVWGDKSRQATVDFQRAYDLTPDGVFGIGTEQRILAVVSTGDKTAQQLQEAPETGGGEDWWKDIRYFTRAEFRCTCGRYGGFPVEPQEAMVRTVDEIRRRLGIPVSVVDAGGSGVRCPEHNAEVGGVVNSEHLYGRAADLHSATSTAKMLAVAEAVMGNTGGIGLYDWGIHVDTGKYSRWRG